MYASGVGLARTRAPCSIRSVSGKKLYAFRLDSSLLPYADSSGS